MSISFPFEYRKLGGFTYHTLSDAADVKSYLMKWIMREWEFDHEQAPDEHWIMRWMNALPGMEFALEIVGLSQICPNAELISGPEFQASLKERADEREESILCGVSIGTLLVYGQGLELMDGYTRYTVLKRYVQETVYVYAGAVGIKPVPTVAAD